MDKPVYTESKYLQGKKRPLEAYQIDEMHYRKMVKTYR